MRIDRLDLGHFVRSAEEAGTPHARVEPVLAYLVRHERGLLLFDTGLGEGDPEADARYRPVRKGLAEALAGAGVRPGVRIVPTPGHTEGHQSLVLSGPDGAVVLAGQAYDFASSYASDEMARRAGHGGIPVPEWLERLAAFAPRRVLFAHDRSVWEGDAAARG
ncbi:hypothetical protein [Streptomyces sp. NPDC015131]|uniref:hypothetical protein n=1 Tax=Streptomyces sp. NPDC015131 TaxID=3364941 RepID=UPI0036FB1E61